MKSKLPIFLAVIGFLGMPLFAAQESIEPRINQPAQNIAATNADPSWRPTAAQREAVVNRTRAYFSARDANQAKAAYAFLSAKQKQVMPFNMFQEILDEDNAKPGRVQARYLRAMTWYKDTPQTGPGLYVAVDFSSTFTNLTLHCGYVVWHEQPDGTFLQMREVANMIDHATMAKLKPEDREKERAKFHC